MSATATNLGVSLISAAISDGNVGAGSAAILGAGDIGAAINNALGVPAISISQDEVVILSILVDDSSSIRSTPPGQSQPNSVSVRAGYNLIIDALNHSKQQNNILTMCQYLNGHVLSPYILIDQAVKMDDRNYDPNGVTPLYDQSIKFLAAVLAKTQDFAQTGVPCRTISLIITDGADFGSRNHSPSDVKTIVQDMLRREQHIVAFMGIDDGHTDFRQVAESMGIDPNWVLTPANTESDIRKACHVFSQSAVRASQSAGSFSQTALGGFAAP